MFYYPPPPPPPANIFHLGPGPYCSIPGPVGISGLFTLNPNPAPPAPTEEKPKAPTKKILIPPLPPPPPPAAAVAPAASTTKAQKKEDSASAEEGSEPKEGKEEEDKKKEDAKAEEKKDAKPEEKKKEGKKEEKKKKLINTYLPPKIPVGTNFWFAAEFTKLHIFNKGVKIWEERWRGDRKAFKAFTVDIHWPVRSIIERTRNQNHAETTAEQQQAASACKGWAVTEVIEVGDNTFFKGTTVAYGSDKAKVSLASMGWNGKRGKSLPPVWLTVHKV
ncbi:hypothetical protein KC343_g7916 [Hortaea werneckii]|nr:hypothetical protein KC352_g15702 [Hortaea werneckii]KAI7562691.1 hypothetical protein KC317_g8240 [Hortaea werneckii]KAI7612423.1 hypothetical protein KC346_g7838 [Hortaea werneckii]KAI7621682.1 hypothetical protein KC343_g7916 [Hortaea werneckii]KAI7663598.1 hypothetical protein KC319_g7710 [Hortaea werneckii]